MKIYNRSFFVLAAVCILPIIYECKHFTGTNSVIWVGFFLYMMVRCFVAAFSKELTTRENDKGTKS